jgi:hypothetical protein
MVIISKQAVQKPGVDLILSAELMGNIQPGPVAVIGISASSDGGIARLFHTAALGGNTIPGDWIFGSLKIICEY